jgi:hypothetical protein
MNNNNYNHFAPAINNSPTLYSPYEGFIKGNLFNNLYSQYKDYKPIKLEPNNKQAELLLAIDQFAFARHELVLYLDINPNDKQIIDLFNTYSKAYNEALGEYERNYGPITLNINNNSNWEWAKLDWPWSKGV